MDNNRTAGILGLPLSTILPAFFPAPDYLGFRAKPRPKHQPNRKSGRKRRKNRLSVSRATRRKHKRAA